MTIIKKGIIFTVVEVTFVMYFYKYFEMELNSREFFFKFRGQFS